MQIRLERQAERHRPPVLKSKDDAHRAPPPVGLPPELRRAGHLLITLAVIQVAIGFLIVSQGPEIMHGLLASDATLRPRDAAIHIDRLIRGSAQLHGMIALVYDWLAMAVGWGRAWVRRLATVCVIAGMVAGVLFVRSSGAVLLALRPYVLLEQAITLGLGAAVLWHLWHPDSVRRFFQARGETGG
jgi:hypothetical protein